MSPARESGNGKRTKIMLATVMTISLILVWVNNLVPFVEPWSWVLLGGVLIMLVATIALLARLVLQQRDDYWRERGRDPKHPEAHPLGDHET